MALGRSYSFVQSKVSTDYFHGQDQTCGNSEKTDEKKDTKIRVGSVRYTRGLGRKRIVISNELDESSSAPLLKRHCSEKITFFWDFSPENKKSDLESLPQDVLIRILCGVDHDDLKQLYNVSKSIREAAVIAKESHFAYSTPTKTRAFRTAVDISAADGGDDDEAETPKAPRQARPRRRLSRKTLSEISVSLFG